MKKDEEEVYRKSLEGVISEHPLLFSRVSKETVAEITFPIWRDTMHKIMMLNMCRCMYHQYDKCFLFLSKEKQIKLYSDTELSFDLFVETLMNIESLSLLSAVAARN